MAARQAASEKKQSSRVRKRPHRVEATTKKMKKEREESPLGKGLPAPLCLWRYFWFPASNCGLEMVGALIRHL